MTNYYYLVSSFSSLKIGEPPEQPFDYWKKALFLNLKEKDQKKLKKFLFYLDLKNIKAFWMEYGMDPRANWEEKELEEALLVPGLLPNYVEDFLSKYQTKEERIRYFSYLYAHFFRSFSSGFLGKYFAQERAVRLHLSALQARRAGLDLVRQLQFEDPTDPEVAYILAQKDREEYDPPVEYKFLKELLNARASYPLALLKAYLEYRFQLIEGIEEESGPFSLDRVLGFMAKLLLVEHFQFFEQEKGKQELQQL